MPDAPLTSPSSTSSFEFTSLSPSHPLSPADLLFHKGFLLPLHPLSSPSDYDPKPSRRPTYLSSLASKLSRALRPIKRCYDRVRGERKAYEFVVKREEWWGRRRRRRDWSWDASCPVSTMSSPIRSGVLETRLQRSSSMDELRSAIEGAIAHCKNSTAGHHTSS